MRAALFALTLLLTACSAEEKPAAPPPPAAPAAPAAPTTPPAAPAAETVTLKELQNGDAACYVIATKASGEELNVAGAFELCQGGPQDASALIGKPVKLTVGRQKILAGSCQGDPEGKDTEEVDVVTAVAASP